MVKITVFGVTYPSLYAAWKAVSEPLGLSYFCVVRRYQTRRGWSPEKVFTQPPKVYDRRPRMERISMEELENGDIKITFPEWPPIIERLSKAMNDRGQVRARAMARIDLFKMAVRED